MNPLKTVCPECGEEFTVSLRGIAVRNRKLIALVEEMREDARTMNLSADPSEVVRQWADKIEKELLQG